VVNANLPPILHRFRDLAFGKSKIAVFGYPTAFNLPDRAVLYIYHRKWYIASN